MQSLKSFKKLQASSIMESVIAISIISICALVAFTIYLNVIKRNESTYYLKAKHKINLLTQQSLLENDYEDDTYFFNGYIIDKQVNVNNMGHTALLKFTVKRGNTKRVTNRLIPYYEK